MEKNIIIGKQVYGRGITSCNIQFNEVNEGGETYLVPKFVYSKWMPKVIKKTEINAKAKAEYWNTLDLDVIYQLGEQKYGITNKDLTAIFTCYMKDENIGNNLSSISKIDNVIEVEGTNTVIFVEEQKRNNWGSVDTFMIDDLQIDDLSAISGKYNGIRMPNVYKKAFMEMPEFILKDAILEYAKECELIK